MGSLEHAPAYPCCGNLTFHEPGNGRCVEYKRGPLQRALEQAPPTPARRSLIVFLDFETTGLDPQRGAEPIELAAIVTDDNFRELGSFETLIEPHLAPSYWDAAAREMHDRSGLGWMARFCSSRREPVGLAFLHFLTGFNAETLHLAGNSIHFDRGFLKHYWPDLERLFHHRMIDVSSLRMVGERVTNAAPLQGEKPHRAMVDVRRSIAELHHWTRALRYADLRGDGA